MSNGGWGEGDTGKEQASWEMVKDKSFSFAILNKCNSKLLWPKWKWMDTSNLFPWKELTSTQSPSEWVSPIRNQPLLLCLADLLVPPFQILDFFRKDGRPWIQPPPRITLRLRNTQEQSSSLSRNEKLKSGSSLGHPLPAGPSLCQAPVIFLFLALMLHEDARPLPN